MQIPNSTTPRVVIGFQEPRSNRSPISRQQASNGRLASRAGNNHSAGERQSEVHLKPSARRQPPSRPGPGADALLAPPAISNTSLYNLRSVTLLLPRSVTSSLFLDRSLSHTPRPPFTGQGAPRPISRASDRFKKSACARRARTLKTRQDRGFLL
jgi:hypothetical protein